MTRTFDIEGTSITGIPIRARVVDTRVSSGAAELIGERQFIELEGGKSDYERVQSLWKKELRISALNNAGVGQVTDAAEDEIQVTATRLDNGRKIFQGYLFPRRLTRRPLLPHDSTVELVANDGLPLLDGDDLDELALTDQNRVKVSEALKTLLDQVYDTPLPVEVGMRTWPQSSQLTASDFPLENVRLDPDNYRERRPDGQSYQTQMKVLEDICSGLGLVCKQVWRDGSLRWHLRQPWAVDSTGSVPMWEMAGGSVSYLGSVDLSYDLQPKIDSGLYDREHSQTFTRSRKSVSFTHDHTEVRSFLKEPGFERDGAEWSLVNTADLTGEVSLHRNTSNTPNETAGDFRFLSAQNFSNTGPGFVASQSGRIVAPESGAGLRLTWNGYNDGADSFDTAFKLQLGTYYVKLFDTTVRAETPEGEGAIPVEPLEVSIPEGATLAVWSGDPRDGTFDFETTIETTARAEPGDTVIAGRANGAVPKNYAVMHLGLTKSEFSFAANTFVAPANRQTWGSRDVSVGLTADDGTEVDARSYSFEVGVGAGVTWLLDDVQLQPVLGGSPLNETVSAATVDSPGKREELEARLSSGPSEDNESRLFGKRFYDNTFGIVAIDTGADTVTVAGDARSALSGAVDPFDIFGSSGNDNTYFGTVDSYDSGANETTIDVSHPTLTDSSTDGSVGVGYNGAVNGFFWGIGADPQTTYPLGELIARQRLRHMRVQPSRWALRPQPPDDPLLFHGHEIIQLRGSTYTVADTQTQPSTGKREITVLQSEDAGTS